MGKFVVNEDLDLQLEGALKGAYAGAIPDGARTVLAVMTDEERALAAARLAAVAAAAAGGSKKDLAESLGVSRQTFYDLLGKWQRFGLAGLVPRESRAPRSLGANERLAQIATRLLRFAPGDARNVDLARRVLWVDDRRRRRSGEAVEVGPAWPGYGRSRDRHPAGDAEGVKASDGRARLAAAQRAVEHARRRLVTDDRYLRRAYGRALVIDCSATSVLLGDRPANAHMALACLVVDRASGLIVGDALGPIGEAAAIQRRSLERGLDLLASRRCDRLPWDGPIAVDVTPAPGLVVDLAGLEPGDRSPPAERVQRTRGHQLIQILGPKVGRLTLHPRFLRESWSDGARAMKLMSGGEAEAYWRREVLRHNQPILDALSAAGLAGAEKGAAHGLIADALERIGGALRSER